MRFVRKRAAGVIRLPLVVLFSLGLGLFAERAAAQGRRVALVVGVGAYQTVARLPNATNDSAAMAELFRKAGFDVVTARSDVGNLEFKRAIREFEDTVADADIAVVFYAGHGIEVRDVNYLIPTDAKLANERDVEDEAITLDRIITALEPAKRLRLIILDACRDNPFASKMKRRVATRAVSAGLSKVEPQQSDTLIAYAAKDKSVAADGDGEHSPFTTALLNNLTAPGLDVRLAFGRIRDEVLRATGRKQEPFVYGSLGGGTVALVPARVETASIAPVNPVADALAQKTDYEIVERVARREAWEVFLNTHKTGLYADLARVQLAKLVETDGIQRSAVPGGLPDMPVRVTPKVEAPPPVAPVPKPTAEEQKAWDRLKTSNDRVAIRKFLERYPSSPLVALAQERLDLLERVAREREDAVRAEREATMQREEEERRRKTADAEQKRLEREAARQREAETKAKAAEIERQRAEALAAAKQREAEERARVAEERARQREAEERVRAAEIAERRRQAEEQARVAEAERQAREREALAHRRELEEQARVAAAAAAAKAMQDREESDKVAAAAREEAERAAAIARAETEERERLAAIERKKADEVAAAKRLELDAARKAAEVDDQQRAKVAEAERQKAEASAVAERQRAADAAKAAAALRREREAAAARREAAETARRTADAEAAANRKKAAEASRRAAERQAERQAEAAERKRREARQAREIRTVHTRPAPQPAPRARAEAYRPAPAPARSGGGAASMVGIGF